MARHSKVWEFLLWEEQKIWPVLWKRFRWKWSPSKLSSGTNQKVWTVRTEKYEWGVCITVMLGPRQALHLLFLDDSLTLNVLWWKHGRTIWGPPEYLASLWPTLYQKNKRMESNNSLNEIWLSPLHGGIYLSLFSWANIDHLNDFPEM